MENSVKYSNNGELPRQQLVKFSLKYKVTGKFTLLYRKLSLVIAHYSLIYNKRKPNCRAIGPQLKCL